MVNTKAVFLLPLVDNDGRSLAAEILEVRTQLWERLTAYTIEGQVQGIFQMADGSRAADVNEKY